MERLVLSTEQPFQLVDITDAVAGLLPGFALDDGAVNLFCPHTSCGLAITEQEEGLHADLEAVLDELAPTTRAWAHDDMKRRWQNIEPDERRNGWSHIRYQLATQPSLVVPVNGGGLGLGRWQRLFLVELDGPRPHRSVLVTPLR